MGLPSFRPKIMINLARILQFRYIGNMNVTTYTLICGCNNEVNLSTGSKILVVVYRSNVG